MKTLALTLISTFVLFGCSFNNPEKQLLITNSMKLTTAEIDTSSLKYDAVVFNKALRATCLDLADEYENEYIILCDRRSGDLTIAEFKILSRENIDIDSSSYTRKIVQRNRKNKKIIHDPILNRTALDTLTTFTAKYDARMEFNIHNINDFYQSGLALRNVDYEAKFKKEVGNLIPANIVDYGSVNKAIDKYFREEYRTRFIDNRRDDNLRSKENHLNNAYYEIKRLFHIYSHINMRYKFCSNNGESLEVCSVTGSPYTKDNYFENNDLKLSLYYSSGVNNNVVEVENKSDSYITMLNLDTLLGGRYYTVNLPSPALPPRSIKQFIFNDNTFRPSFTVSNNQDSISYGFTAQYRVNDKVGLFNEVKEFNPIRAVKSK
ncbi:hypothetical protein FR932_19945 [Moritella marina ATCC 15381]|uniref:Lipoprotein n=1 Tax=Moritella marina ATCC 15381 TaxID=1202962 RepID=A0A5J6WR85_MORMI|nr:hypothetical protein [Moritella marina]QFI39924.1 hypothetical protein FR932_19945 [Moritella marina ATCC 15381]